MASTCYSKRERVPQYRPLMAIMHLYRYIFSTEETSLASVLSLCDSLLNVWYGGPYSDRSTSTLEIVIAIFDFLVQFPAMPGYF